MDAPGVLAELRRESQSIFNRIHSIAEDAAFVEQVHGYYPKFPLLPNMRCGAWYTDPEIASVERAYFKSTDGHTNNWSFNLRRPNLHLLSLIVEHGGLVLVDSTRAGKRIPDALSKTVPIWCAVVNRAIRLRRVTEPDPQPRDAALYTPPGSVSSQEHSQIEHKLDGWASQLAASSYRLLDLDRPLRPIWITPAATVFPTFPELPDRAFYPILCVSASKQVTDGIERRASGFAYIQGSGDDHELWGMGLTPRLYWRHCDAILNAGPSDLPDLIRVLVTDAGHTEGDATGYLDCSLSHGTPIARVSGRIAIGSVASLHLWPDVRQCQALPRGDVAWLLLCSPAATPPPPLTEPSSDSPVAGPTTATTTAVVADSGMQTSRMLCIQTPGGKKGQHHFLTGVLPRALPFVQRHLQHERRTVCIACPTGTDASVGVAVAALAVFFRSDGSLCAREENVRDSLSKDVLKDRLHWIIASYPQANPSRTTLKRVNDFLLSPWSETSSMLGIPNRASVDRTSTFG